MATGRALGPALGRGCHHSLLPLGLQGKPDPAVGGGQGSRFLFFFFSFSSQFFFLSSWLPTARKPGPSELERTREGLVRRMYLIQQETSGFLEQPLPEPPEFCGHHVLLLSIRPDFVPDHRTVESVEGVL